jgi:predicted aspartyl protease
MRLGVVVVVGGLAVVAGPSLLRHVPVKPQSAGPVLPSGKELAGRRVIASAKIDGGNRCKIGGRLDGVPLTFMVDTGAPRTVEISADLLPKLGRTQSQYQFEELWPGTRYGKIARTTFDELRIDSFVLARPDVRIYDRWSYSFGNDTAPLLGMGALKERGVRLEIEGDTCRLTMPETRSAAR